jgi:hypothetical protein
MESQVETIVCDRCGAPMQFLKEVVDKEGHRVSIHHFCGCGVKPYFRNWYRIQRPT